MLWRLGYALIILLPFFGCSFWHNLVPFLWFEFHNWLPWHMLVDVAARFRVSSVVLTYLVFALSPVNRYGLHQGWTNVILQTQKWMVPLLRAKSYQTFPPFSPGISQNTAVRASSAVREFYLSDFYLPSLFNVIFPIVFRHKKYQVSWTVTQTYTWYLCFPFIRPLRLSWHSVSGVKVLVRKNNETFFR